MRELDMLRWCAFAMMTALATVTAGCAVDAGDESAEDTDATEEAVGNASLGFTQNGQAVTSVVAGSTFQIVGKVSPNGQAVYDLCPVGGACTLPDIQPDGTFSVQNDDPTSFGVATFFGTPCPGKYGCYAGTYTFHLLKVFNYKHNIAAQATLTVTN